MNFVSSVFSAQIRGCSSDNPDWVISLDIFLLFLEIKVQFSSTKEMGF